MTAKTSKATKAAKTAKTAKSTKTTKATTKINWALAAEIRGTTIAEEKAQWAAISKYKKFYDLLILEGIPEAYCKPEYRQSIGGWDYKKKMPSRLAMCREFIQAGLSPQDAAMWATANL